MACDETVNSGTPKRQNHQLCGERRATFLAQAARKIAFSPRESRYKAEEGVGKGGAGLGKDEKRERLAQVLMQAMNTLSLEELRIQDLCEQARISKSTFYRLFTDKYDLAFWIYQNQADQAIADCPELSQWDAWTYRIFATILQNKAFYRNYAAYSGQNSLFECLIQYYQGNILRYRKTQGSGVTEDQQFAVYAFSVAGARATVDWILNGFTPSPETVYRKMQLCVPECIREFYR